MAKVTITSPNPDYNGVSAGVRFTDGKAEIDDQKQLAALEYFGRHRFGISREVVNDEHPELTVPASPDPSDDGFDKLDKPALQDAARAAGLDDSGTKAELIERLRAPKAPAESVTSGPVGPQHNSGHDGANPDGDEPQLTPADAGI